MGAEMKSMFIKKGGRVGEISRQGGASLLEGIAYLGIAALVILGAVSLLASAFGNAQANQATEEIVSLRTAVRKLYAGQPYPAAPNITGTLIAARAVPGTLTVAGANITNSWGGAVTIGGAGGTFTIVFPNVPQDVCVNMLSGASGWTSVGRTGQPPINVMPLTAANAAAICNAANNNSVEFTGA
jgi:hypothetical protein